MIDLKVRSIVTIAVAFGLVVLQPNWANATSSGSASENESPLTSTLTVTDASGNVVSSQTSEGALVSSQIHGTFTTTGSPCSGTSC